MNNFNWKNKKVLIVDDDAMHRFLLKEFIKRTGADIVLAKSGSEALNYFNSGLMFDVVLIDSSMWEMDGYETTRKIKMGGLNVSVIMISGYTMPENIERAYAVGCDLFLSKPVARDRLLREMDNVMNQCSKEISKNYE